MYSVINRGGEWRLLLIHALKLTIGFPNDSFNLVDNYFRSMNTEKNWGGEYRQTEGADCPMRELFCLYGHFSF